MIEMIHSPSMELVYVEGYIARFVGGEIIDGKRFQSMSPNLSYLYLWKSSGVATLIDTELKYV
jgi:hypothetical protein